MPLTTQGYTATRASEYLASIRVEVEAFVADTYGETIDWDADVWTSLLVSIVANRLGSLSELTQSVFDAGDPNNAAGSHLDSLCAMVGLERIPATPSVATVTLSGTAGTIVTSGKKVFGASNTWTLQSDVTIPGDGVVACDTDGPIQAAAGDLATIASPVVGWSGVTNAAAVVPGTDTETDAKLRLRRESRIRGATTNTVEAVRTRLLALDYIQTAVVIENRDASEAFVLGELMPGCSVQAVVYPDPTTEERKSEVALAIYDSVAMATGIVGDTSGTVTAPNGLTTDVAYTVATQRTVTVNYAVTKLAGYANADIRAQLEALTIPYVESLAPGALLASLPLCGLASQVEGLIAAVPTIEGGDTYQSSAIEVLTAVVTVSVLP